MGIGKKKEAGTENLTGRAAARVTTAETAKKKVSRLSAVTGICAAVAAASLVFAGVTWMTTNQRLEEQKATLTPVACLTETVPAGSILKASMLTTKDVPSAYVAEGAMTLDDAKGLVGERTLVELGAGEQVTASDVTGIDGDSAYGNRLEKSEKGVSIKVDAETGLAQSLLHQGDKVDLYYYTPVRASDGKQRYDSEGKPAVTKHVLARGLTVGALNGYTSYDDISSDGVTSSYSTVSVNASKKVAEKIREVQGSGTKIYMVLQANVDFAQGK